MNKRDKETYIKFRIFHNKDMSDLIKFYQQKGGQNKSMQMIKKSKNKRKLLYGVQGVHTGKGFKRKKDDVYQFN